MTDEPSRPVAVVKRNVNAVGQYLYTHVLVWCPACEELHAFRTEAAVASQHTPVWEFDGNLEAPTFSPSMLVIGGPQGSEARCHSFLRAGVWDFLSDCTHPMAGTKVPMVPLPEWLVQEPS